MERERSTGLSLFLEDDSRKETGTFINNSKLTKKTIVRNGDVIRLGDIVEFMLFDPATLHHRLKHEKLFK